MSNNINSLFSLSGASALARVFTKPKRIKNIDCHVGLKISRRAALKLGVASISMAPISAMGLTKPSIEVLTGGPGERIVILLVNGEVRWSVNADHFDGNANLEVHRTPTTLIATLRQASYPGTNIRSDFRLEANWGVSVPYVVLRFPKFGFLAKGELVPWLMGNISLRSNGSVRGVGWKSPDPTGRLNITGSFRGAVRHDGTVILSGNRLANLSLTNIVARSSEVEIRPILPTQRTITNYKTAAGTSIILKRSAGEQWNIGHPALPAEDGEVHLFTESLRRLYLETWQGGHNAALMVTGDNNEDMALYRFPAKKFSTALETEEIHLTRLAIVYGLTKDRSETVLTAGLNKAGCKLALNGCTVHLGDREQAFSVLWQNDSFSSLIFKPRLASTQFFVDGLRTRQLDVQVGQVFEFSNFLTDQPDQLPIEKTENEISSRLILNKSGETVLDVLNPQLKLENERDLMTVTFEGVNIRLRSSSREMRFFSRWPRDKDRGASTATSYISRQWLEVTDTDKPAYLVLHLPPQSIAEQAIKDIDGPLGKEWYPPLMARMSGPSRLVFELPKEAEPIPLNREALFDSLRFAMKLVPPVRPKGKIKAPTRMETAIEFPYRLFISPDEDGNGGQGNNAWNWKRSLPAEGREGWESLWTLSYESSYFDPLFHEPPKIRAVWSPDFGCNEDSGPRCNPNKPFLTSLSPRNRNDIVNQSHLEGVQNLRAVEANKLKLTPLGAWSDLYGFWPEQNQGSFGSLESWEHVAAMGRDNRVVIVERGSLFPLRHKAALVTVSERKYKYVKRAWGRPMVRGAYLMQRKFIVVRDPIQIYNKAEFPFVRVDVIDKITPDLNLNKGRIPKVPRNDNTIPNARWPYVENNIFEFRLKGWDWEAREVSFSAPLIFVADHDKYPKYIVDEYLKRKNFDRRARGLGGQSLAMAPLFSSGDTIVEAEIILFGAGKAHRYREKNKTPYYDPVVERIKAEVPSLKQRMPQDDNAGIGWLKPNNPQPPKDVPEEDNPGVFAKVVDPPNELPNEPSSTLELSFKSNSKGSGGIAAPGFKVTALTRKHGPVGGDNHSAGFRLIDNEIGEYFGDAKILGSIRLGDVISGLQIGSGSGMPNMLDLMIPVGDGPTEIMQTLDWETDELQSWPNENNKEPIFIAQQTHEKRVPKENEKTKLRISSGVDGPLELGTFPKLKIEGFLTNFSISLFELIEVQFKELKFKAAQGAKTTFDVNIHDVGFSGDLEFVQQLAENLKFFNDKAEEQGMNFDIDADGVRVTLPPILVPSFSVGIFSIFNMGIFNRCTLPFTNAPISFNFAMSTPDNPFLLSVSGLAGGGSVGIEVDTEGIQEVEISLEFGAMIAVSLGVANGSLYVFGGIYYKLDKVSSKVDLRAYVRAGGQLTVLSLITISAEFYISLNIAEPKSEDGDNKTKYIYGEARVTGTIKIGFLKKSYTVMYIKEFAGSQSRKSIAKTSSSNGFKQNLSATSKLTQFTDTVSKDQWCRYWDAFA